MKIMKWICLGCLSLGSADSLFSSEGGFSELAHKRHSSYYIDSEKEVSEKLLNQMTSIASLSPSNYNEQPWRFIICDRTRTPEAYQKALDSLVELNRKWAEYAPVLIIVVADSISSYTQQPNLWAQYDAGAAAMSLVYQATDLGVIAHEMGGFDYTKLKASFAIPDRFIPMTVVAVGYEYACKETEQIPQKIRRPIGETVFWGQWNP